MHLITGSIARSTTRRYLSYSEVDFEVFRLAGATRCTDRGGIWHRGDLLLHAKFHPNGAKLGYRTPKTEIFTEI